MNDPDHAITVPWVRVESDALAHVASLVKTHLQEVDKKQSRKRVHDARTALKRWTALWSVLAADGWESAQDEREVVKPLHKLFKQLGKVRDLDVNLKKSAELGVSDSLCQKWKRQRKQERKKLNRRLRKVDVDKLCAQLDKFLKREPEVVSQQMAKSNLGTQSGQAHVDYILQGQERVAHKLAVNPVSVEEYHAVRKELKKWMYLLEELAHSKNDQLKNIESKLGDLHDLDRMEPQLTGDEKNISALGNLRAKREQLIVQLQDLPAKLPFGARGSTGTQAA